MYLKLCLKLEEWLKEDIFFYFLSNFVVQNGLNKTLVLISSTIFLHIIDFYFSTIKKVTINDLDLKIAPFTVIPH